LNNHGICVKDGAPEVCIVIRSSRRVPKRSEVFQVINPSIILASSDQYNKETTIFTSAFHSGITFRYILQRNRRETRPALQRIGRDLCLENLNPRKRKFMRNS